MQSQPDFQYNNNDVNQLNIAYQSLQTDEKYGFVAGMSGWMYSAYICSRYLKIPRGFQYFSSFLVGAVC